MLKRLRGRSKPETFEMTAAGLDAPVLVRRSPRARRLSLSVNEARRGAVLTVPRHASLEEAGDFLTHHYDWLKARLAALPEAVPFAEGAAVPLRGEPHVLAFGARGRGRGVVWAEDGETMPRLYVSGAPEHAPRRLKDWLKREARRDLCERSEWHAANLGLRVKRVTIRDQSTRWGSCSSSGVLSFSWRLILAPPSVLDYLAAHEVAHLKEMNHGPRFWALVERTMPDMKPARAWLKTNGGKLHGYGVNA